jgi:inhibitor of KinA
MDTIRMLTAGEQGLVVEFGNTISPVINAKVHRLAELLQRELGSSLLEVVPTYRSLLVYFDPLAMTRQVLSEKISAFIEQDSGTPTAQNAGRVVVIPVCYGGEYGPDLPFVAQHNGLTTEEVIAIHTSSPYLVYMLGFTPGFPYLGGMSEKIATPRLEKPRTKIPAGSVGIAGSQTGFYPVESPGGWQLIGRTPVKAFTADSANPFLFAAGDYLQFEAITEKEYISIQKAVEAGSYQAQTGVTKGGDER